MNINNKIKTLMTHKYQVSSVIQERKKSLEDKNRELAKLSEVGFRMLTLFDHYGCDIRVIQMQATKNSLRSVTRRPANWKGV